MCGSRCRLPVHQAAEHDGGLAPGGGGGAVIGTIDQPQTLGQGSVAQLVSGDGCPVRLSTGKDALQPGHCAVAGGVQQVLDQPAAGHCPIVIPVSTGQNAHGIGGGIGIVPLLFRSLGRVQRIVVQTV